jgi:hypothetical protein
MPGGDAMKPIRTHRWLRRARSLARFFFSPGNQGAASSRGIFRLSSAEAWRVGQARRSQFLAALLKRKRKTPTVNTPDRFPVRTDLTCNPARRNADHDAGLRRVAHFEATQRFAIADRD